MADDYTPTTGEVRAEYVCKLVTDGEPVNGAPVTISEASEIFNRWLAALIAEKRAEWEAELGKPAPCVMTHTPPFDFAQCETHDETFPLGDVCKWHGKESVTEVLQDEVDEQRARAVRAEHQLEILRAEQGEPTDQIQLVDNRDPECVKAWPGCHTFGYDPACCRFPKSCSAGTIATVTNTESEKP